MEANKSPRAWVYVYKTGDNEWTLLNRWDEPIKTFNAYDAAIHWGDENSELIDIRIGQGIPRLMYSCICGYPVCQVPNIHTTLFTSQLIS